MAGLLSKLTQQADFSFVYRTGKRLSFPGLVVRYSRVVKGPSRFAVVASVKEVGKAVARNRARRRIWEALRKYRDLYPTHGYYIVFILKKAIISQPWTKLSDAIKKTTSFLR